MINVKIYKSCDRIFAFSVENHGDSIVCAGVSMLVINTINAIEQFCDTNYTVDVDEKNAIISAEFSDIFKGKPDEKVDVLLNTLELGLLSTESNYTNDIKVKIEEVQQC